MSKTSERYLQRGPAPDLPKRSPLEIEQLQLIAVLRSENARLKEQAASNAANMERERKTLEDWRKEIFRLQNELFASQEQVYELQKKLLALGQIVNDTAMEQAP